MFDNRCPFQLGFLLGIGGINSRVVGIDSDALFTLHESQILASLIPNSHFETLSSPDGHDGFLLEFQEVSDRISGFISRQTPQFVAGRTVVEVGGIVSSSVGEAEVGPTTSKDILEMELGLDENMSEVGDEDEFETYMRRAGERVDILRW